MERLDPEARRARGGREWGAGKRHPRHDPAWRAQTVTTESEPRVAPTSACSSCYPRRGNVNILQTGTVRASRSRVPARAARVGARKKMTWKKWHARDGARTPQNGASHPFAQHGTDASEILTDNKVMSHARRTGSVSVVLRSHGDARTDPGELLARECIAANQGRLFVRRTTGDNDPWQPNGTKRHKREEEFVITNTGCGVRRAGPRPLAAAHSCARTRSAPCAPFQPHDRTGHPSWKAHPQPKSHLSDEDQPATLGTCNKTLWHPPDIVRRLRASKPGWPGGGQLLVGVYQADSQP